MPNKALPENGTKEQMVHPHASSRIGKPKNLRGMKKEV